MRRIREMIKNNKWRLLISSVLIVLPIAVGFLLWDRLPEQMTTHWGADGAPDGYMDRLWAILSIPLILLAVQWICALLTAFDRSNDGKNRKVRALVLWIVPILSWMVNGALYALALGWELDATAIGALAMGGLFIVIGNYLPKCRQNHTIGIKLSWTLSSEENWNATHRVAGRVWMIGGALMLLGMFLPSAWFVWAMLGISLVLVLIPLLYSWRLWHKQAKEGKVPEKASLPLGKGGKIASGIVLTVVGVILVLVVILLFTGEIGVTFGEDAFTVKATYGSTLTVDYDEITGLELVEKHEMGARIYGFGSPRLELGQFENETWGAYTRYAYGGAEQAVVVRCGDRILVIAVGDGGETKAVYDALSERIEY